MVVFRGTTDRRFVLAAAFGLAADIFASECSPVRGASEPTASGSFSLDRMIGEMIVMGFTGDHPASPGARAISTWLRDGLVGGVIFFEDNLRSGASGEADAFPPVKDRPR